MVSDDPQKNHMFTDWYRNLKEGNPIVSIEGQHFSPTYVNDVALAIELASRISLKGIYHVANPEFFTRDELARQFVRALGMKSEFIVRRESEFGFSDRRTLKAYMDGSKFIDITNIRFIPMSKLFLSFKEKLEGMKKEEMVSSRAN
jgi:dTDP-4-dehydrorhamnose reductase